MANCSQGRQGREDYVRGLRASQLHAKNVLSVFIVRYLDAVKERSPQINVQSISNGCCADYKVDIILMRTCTSILSLKHGCILHGKSVCFMKFYSNVVLPNEYDIAKNINSDSAQSRKE